MQEVNEIYRIYNTKSNNDEILFDIYEMILAKLDNDLLVKET